MSLLKDSVGNLKMAFQYQTMETRTGAELIPIEDDGESNKEEKEIGRWGTDKRRIIAS